MASGDFKTQRSEETITWAGVDFHCRRLLSNLKYSGIRFDCILAIARGGLVPAAILAQAFKIHDIVTISVNCYDDETNKRLAVPVYKENLFSPQFKKLDRQQTLVVDDIADSGITMSVIRHALPQAFRTALVVKRPGIEFVHTFSYQVDPSVWVKFPWEKSYGQGIQPTYYSARA